MQTVVKLENVQKNGKQVHRLFIAASIVSATIMFAAWNNSLSTADRTIQNIRTEAKVLDADTKRTALERDAIWINQMQPKFDEAVFFQMASPASAVTLFLAFCLVRYLMFSKRAKARLQQILDKAGRNEYSHSKALTIALGATVVPVLLVVCTSFDLKLAACFATFWSSFIYIALAPLSIKKACKKTAT